MSTKIQKDIVCPACGQTQKLEMYTSVNAEENPELRRDILRESIFDWECRHCGYTAQMAYPMIYHDPMNAFMICLRPSGAVSGAEPIPAVRALKKRSVKNPQELKEKILIFEAGLDDAAVELVKNAIVTVVRKNLDGNVHAYFCAATEEELRFALFVKGWEGKFFLLIIFKINMWNSCASKIFGKIHMLHSIRQIANIHSIIWNDVLHCSNYR